MSSAGSRDIALVAFAAVLAVGAGCGGSGPSSATTTARGQTGTTYLVRLARPTKGTISSGDGKIHCGAVGVADACGPATYPWNETATLTATPDPGYTFGMWAGDCTGRALCVLHTSTSGADKYVLAVFGPAGVVQHSDIAAPSKHGPEYFDRLAGKPDALACNNAACHGVVLQGAGITPSCHACHARAGWTSWQTNCSFCHGVKSPASQAGYDFATNPSLAAPGDAISARLTGTPAPDRTGAHAAHLSGMTAGGLAFAAPFRCDTCHAVPADLSHVGGAGGRATVALSGAGQASLSASLGSYDPATGTCTTYCHGTSPSPAWSAKGLQCGGCHEVPPDSPHPQVTELTSCAWCHSGTVKEDGSLDVAGGKHVDGKVDVRGGNGGVGCAACHGAPPVTGAHVAHRGASAPPPSYGDSRPLGCGNCHPTDTTQHAGGAQVLNPNVVLPGGTRTTGAQMTGSPPNVSCTVACHFPLGAPQPAQPVAWNAVGPLPCTSCHTAINPERYVLPQGFLASRHDPIFSEARPASGELTTCWSCHDSAGHGANHLTGAPALVASGTLDDVCIRCHTPPRGPTGPSQVLHRGSGVSYVEKTPPVLVGWTDTVNGDFHGARVGTGFNGSFGGTLKAPYVRGQGPLPCTACHATHVSGNSFLFAPLVNDTAIPAGRITRAGVGGELLCNACHQGQNHAGCLACHASDPQPAGSACFLCHGHEGIRHFASPYFDGPHDEPSNGRDCRHCHSGGWLGAVDSQPPVINPPGPQVTSITATSAIVSWNTSESATTYVEYGVGTAGYVAGDDAETGTHSVTLAGLAPDTTYVWRVRSADRSRNVTRSPLASFTTPGANAVPKPDLAGVTGGAQVPDSTMVATLRWYPVTAPSGTVVEYEVQLASDPGFTAIHTPSGWIPGTPTGSVGSPPRPSLGFDVTITGLPQDWCDDTQPDVYYYRVRARDQVGNVSEWSTPRSFGAIAGNPDC
jgi:hypothetical protein